MTLWNPGGGGGTGAGLVVGNYSTLAPLTSGVEVVPSATKATSVIVNLKIEISAGKIASYLGTVRANGVIVGRPILTLTPPSDYSVVMSWHFNLAPGAGFKWQTSIASESTASAEYTFATLS